MTKLILLTAKDAGKGKKSKQRKEHNLSSKPKTYWQGKLKGGNNVDKSYYDFMFPFAFITFKDKYLKILFCERCTSFSMILNFNRTDD